MTNATGRRTTIGVIGKNEQHANDPVSAATMQLAHEIGRLIAAKGGVVVTGGLGGVMSAASRGAKEAGGLTIGFLPSMDRDSANEFVDVVFPTGLGRARNLLTARGCDSIVMIGGGCGTLNELTIAYADGRPVIILRGSGGLVGPAGAVSLRGPVHGRTQDGPDPVRRHAGRGRRQGIRRGEIRRPP